MEHLPRVLDPEHPDWEVPYLNAHGSHESHWDGGDFATFPERQGWDVEKLYGGHYKPAHTEEETSTMLQEWLYFGMLAEVLTRPINHAEFLRKTVKGQYVITTVLLEDYLYDWIDINRKMPKEVQDNNRRRAKKAIEITSYYINRNPSADRLSPLSRRHEDIIMSIRLLGHILGHWGTKHIWKSGNLMFLGIPTRSLAGVGDKEESMVYGFSGPGYASTNMMKERTRDWCPHDRRRLQETLSVSTVFYLSTMKSLEIGKDHQRCSEDVCYAYNVDPATYETSHADGCSKASCDFLEIPEKDLIEVIENNGLPLILIETTGEDVSISVVRWEAGMEFNAISHVWSDGLGNEPSNSLPKCQLLHIAAALRAKSNNCIEDVGDLEWRREKRPESLKDRVEEFDRRLKLLGKRAANVAFLGSRELVTKGFLEKPQYSRDPSFDHTEALKLQSIWGNQIEQAKNKPDQEESTAQTTAPETSEPQLQSHGPLLFWMDTLCIPKKLAFRKKAINEMSDVYEHAKSVLVLDSQIRRVPKAASSTEIMGRTMLSGWIRRLWTYQESLLATNLNFRVADGAVNYFDANFFSKISGNIILDDIFQRFPAGPTGVVSRLETRLDRYLILKKVVETLSWRSLSNPRDEVLVLCLLLHMGRDEINQVMNSPKEQRMQRFWSVQKRVPRGVIIWQGPRLPDDGFKWAPATLLTPLRKWREQPPYTPAQITTHGMLAKYIGWVFTVDISLEQSFYVWDKSGNAPLNVYPAHDETKTNKWVKGSRVTPQRYGVVVLSPVPERRYTYGALLSVYKEEGGTYYTNYVCQVNVERAKAGDTFEEKRFMAALSSGVETVVNAVRRFGAAAENEDREPSWCIG
ncbi:uncharacterized protein PAC_16423 [Phialocephala subalpina]|uniref:Heterokaryon incompatibility domain-containing protein n=1 Tax=Phialocephala subalpina TaxID=576137 RepID=A0A1L7XNB5_9HELO|nr:uncharacterized protein PAC_16423 [Phialocephala subalpina]